MAERRASQTETVPQELRTLERREFMLSSASSAQASGICETTLERHFAAPLTRRDTSEDGHRIRDVR